MTEPTPEQAAAQPAPPSIAAELRTLATICRHVGKLSPAGRTWLRSWLSEGDGAAS